MKFTDDLIKHGSLVFFASALANMFSLLFQLFMARNLSEINFGDMNSLFAMLMIVSIPLGPIQTVVTKFVSSFYAHHQLEKIRLLLFKLGKRILLLGLLIFLVVTFGSRIISSFLQITSNYLVIMIGFIMLLSIILPLTYGALQGFQRFGFLGLNIILSGAIKLLLGIFLVTMGFEVMGVLGAVAGSAFLALIVSLFMLRTALNEPSALSEATLKVNAGNPVPNEEIMKGELNLSRVYGYFIPVSITFLCFMVLTNIDIILVKHFFSPLMAGYYSYSQMVGKIITFLPAAIIVVMFTKVSHLHAQHKDTIPILKKTLMIVGLLCGIATLICILFPSLIIRLLSGKEHLECIPLVRLFAIAMTFFGLAYTLSLYYLSIHRFNFIYPLLFCAALQIALILFFHKTLSQVLYILSANSLLLFIINLRLIKRPAIST